MNPYAYIKKEWIVSASANRIYRISASLSIAFFILLVEAIVADGFPSFLYPVARPLIFLGALAIGVTGAGMEIFLFRYDESSGLKQIVWFLVMIFPLLGPALFYFFVYARSEQVRKCASQELAGAS